MRTPHHYRAKRKHNQRGNETDWIYGLIYDKPAGSETYFIRQYMQKIEVDVNTAGMSIGRQDTNGQEIYEGDALRLYNKERNTEYYKGRELVNDPETSDAWVIVEWNDDECGFVLKDYFGNEDFDVFHEFEESDLRFVIGNIHDNPDLVP